MIEDDRLDEEFPLGDGTADTDAVVHCPYCGEANEIALDPGRRERPGVRGGLPGLLSAVDACYVTYHARRRRRRSAWPPEERARGSDPAEPGIPLVLPVPARPLAR